MYVMKIKVKTTNAVNICYLPNIDEYLQVRDGYLYFIGEVKDIIKFLSLLLEANVFVSAEALSDAGYTAENLKNFE